MSFLDQLKRIGGVLLHVDAAAAPIVSLFNPAAGTIMTIIANAAVRAEQAHPGEGQSQVKSDFSKIQFDQQLGNEITAGILAARGETVTYDAVKWKAMNDAQVALLDAVAEFKATLGTTKVVQ